MTARNLKKLNLWFIFPCNYLLSAKFLDFFSYNKSPLKNIEEITVPQMPWTSLCYRAIPLKTFSGKALFFFFFFDRFALLEKTMRTWVEVLALLWVIAFSLLKVSSTARAILLSSFPYIHVLWCYTLLTEQLCCVSGEIGVSQESKPTWLANPFLTGAVCVQQTTQPSHI